MRTILSFCLPAAALLWLTGCGLFRRDVLEGSGNVVSQTREASGFGAIQLEGEGEVVITQGAADAVTIEAEDNLQPVLSAVVRNGTLVLGWDRSDFQGEIRPTRPVRFLVTAAALEALDLSGTGDMHAASLDADMLALRLSGSGSVAIEHLQAERLDVRLDGTGSITVGGQVVAQDVVMTGTGEYAAGELESQTATVDLPGTGNITVWVRDTLSISLSGTGSVSYFGTPTLARRDITGQGDVNPMGDK